MRQLGFVLSISLTTFLLAVHPSVAQTAPVPVASKAPVELDLLTNPKGSVITADTINQAQLSVPSLWWAKENSENKLLDNWIVYPASDKEAKRIDLVVNQQIWSLLDYLERYHFVNALGTVARNQGYNVRIFNYQEERLATYTCNFGTSPILCNINMNSHNQIGLPRSL
jgi:hypothetical protein